MSASRLTFLLFLSACGALTRVRGTYPGDRVMWDDIDAHAEPLTLPGRPVAVVAPHHLIDAHELAGFWRELAKPRPPVVVIIGPDHYARGAGVTVGRKVRFETVYGPLDVDAALSKTLGGATRDEAFDGEHSIHVHAPFLRRALPEARFVPVLVQWAAPRAELETLAQRLNAELPADALVVASVDFSHYQPEPWATFHDESAYSSVSGFHLDELFLREVDSPESLFVAMRFAQLRGAQTATRVLHTNSQRRREVLVLDSTSHQYFTFTPGPVVPHPSVSVTITPDLPGLGVFEGWTWHPTRDTGAPRSPLLADLRGKEDRFFMGPELAVLHLEPGEVLRRELHGFTVLVAREPVTTPLEGDCVIRLPLPAERPVVHGVTCTRAGQRVRTVPVVLTPEGPRLDVDALAEQLER